MGMDESHKPKSGGPGSTEGPWWGPGAMALVGVRRRSPLKLKAFTTSKVWKTPFPSNLSCFKQPLTKYSLLCFKAFFQRNKPGTPQPPLVRGSGGETPWRWGLLLYYLRYENPISCHFILFQTATHKIPFTVLEGFLPEEQTRQRQRSISKDFILLT